MFLQCLHPAEEQGDAQTMGEKGLREETKGEGAKTNLFRRSEKYIL